MDLGLIMDGKRELTDRILFTSNRRNAIIVFDTAINESKLLILATIVWPHLVEVLQGDVEFPTYNQMLGKLAGVIGQKPNEQTQRPAV